MKPSLFWHVTQRRLVISTDIQEYFFLDCLTLEEWTDRLSRNVVSYQSTLRDIGGLIYTAAEAYSFAQKELNEKTAPVLRRL